ncbi:MAG: hypothetical protein ACRYGR_02895 [Janthinobacterium lividum]
MEKNLKWLNRKSIYNKNIKLGPIGLVVKLKDFDIIMLETLIYFNHKLLYETFSFDEETSLGLSKLINESAIKLDKMTQ